MASAQASLEDSDAKLDTSLKKLLSDWKGTFCFMCKQCHLRDISPEVPQPENWQIICSKGRSCKQYNFVYIPKSAKGNATACPIRKIPHVDFSGDFQMCRSHKSKKKCSSSPDLCTCAHSKVELHVWNFMKNNHGVSFETISIECGRIRGGLEDMAFDFESDDDAETAIPRPPEVRDKRPFCRNGDYLLCKQ